MRPEDRFQTRCRMFLDAYLPAACKWSSIGHERKQTLQQGQRQKARGVKRGLPDIMVWAPHLFLGFELKAGKNDVTDAQEAFGKGLRALGHVYEVVRSVEQLGEILVRNDVALAPGWQIKAQLHDMALDTKLDHVPARVKPRKPVGPKPTMRQIAAGNRWSLALARGGK